MNNETLKAAVELKEKIENLKHQLKHTKEMEDLRRSHKHTGYGTGVSSANAGGYLRVQVSEDTRLAIHNLAVADLEMQLAAATAAFELL